MEGHLQMVEAEDVHDESTEEMDDENEEEEVVID